VAIVFDSAKDAANVAKHGVSLSRAADLDIVAYVEDARHDYGEIRYRAFGYLDGRPHCLVFTDRDGVIRAISLRRSHMKEMERHASRD
jgi:uncharacterized DUF497 family protein